jgi:hypothetical protein
LSTYQPLPLLFLLPPPLLFQQALIVKYSCLAGQLLLLPLLRTPLLLFLPPSLQLLLLLLPLVKPLCSPYRLPVPILLQNIHTQGGPQQMGFLLTRVLLPPHLCSLLLVLLLRLQFCNGLLCHCHPTTSCSWFQGSNSLRLVHSNRLCSPLHLQVPCTSQGVLICTLLLWLLLLPLSTCFCCYILISQLNVVSSKLLLSIHGQLLDFPDFVEV